MLNELDLHVTNRCTTNCEYCCFSSNRLRLTEMSFEDICKIINDAKKMGCSHLHITGGEPLLRADILDIVEFASLLDFEVRLQTNGMLLDENKAIVLKEKGLQSIMISLDSFIEISHDSMRGKGTYKLALKAIDTAIKAGLDVRVNSVLTKVNYREIYDTIIFLDEMGVKKYSAFYFSPIGSGGNALDKWIEPLEYNSFWKKLMLCIKSNERLKKMDIIIEKAYAEWQEAKEIDISSFTGCGGGCFNTYTNRDYLIVRCDGNVYPCIMAIDSKPLGNIYQNSLCDIHNRSEEWEKLLPLGDEECKKCQYVKLCNEGCRYYPLLNNVDKNHDCRCINNVIVPLCPIMKYNFSNGALGGSSDDVMLER